MGELDYKLYVIAELNYKKAHPDMSEEALYPEDWYSITNYKLKNEIIAEAIRNKVLIKDTEKYILSRQDVRESQL